MKGNEQINTHPNLCLSEEHFRTNDVLSEQIAIIQEFAPQLSPIDLQQLEAKLTEIEIALNKLKELMLYLPE
ncbi:MAG: hypothetical protein PHH28_05355 [Desulfuromonadaceae bacterium]|nr:hypothetical protein [Desulfuromonadaceae bacterium]